MAQRRLLPLAALLAADGASRLGNAITIVAVPLLALQISGTPFAVAAASVAATLPAVIGGALGGVVVDRIGFRRASILADTASAATILTIPVLAALDALPLWALLTLVLLSNLLDAPGNAARASQIPELCDLAGVPLPRAAALQATISRTAMLLGASAAGLLVATTTTATTLVATAACFAVALTLTVALVPSIALDATDADAHDSSGWRGLTAGLRFVARTPLIRAVVVMVVLTNAVDIAGATVLKPLYAAELGSDGAALGVLIASSAAGALVGAALYGMVGDRVPRHALYVTLFLLAGVPPYAALALALPLPAVAVVLFFSGLAAGPLNPLIDSALFRLIPAGIRARVLGAIAAGVTAAMPLGSVLAGAGAEAFGLTATLVLAAGAYLGIILTTGFGARWREF